MGKIIKNGIEYAGAGGVSSSSITDAFSATSTYEVGALCIHSNQLYRCTTAITTPGAWDESKWTATSVMDEVANVREISAADYEALTQAEKNNGTIYIISGDSVGYAASVIDYDNTTSGMSATNVQAAVDELNSDLSALLQWSNPVNSITNVPATAHDIQVNTIVADSGALGSILIPYNAYGTYIFGGWDSNYAILEYQSGIFDISLYLNGTTYQHRAYTIVYR